MKRKNRIYDDEDFRYWLVANNIEPGLLFALAKPSVVKGYRAKYLATKVRVKKGVN